MSNFIIALFLAAGASAFMYTKSGARLGYGNAQKVWGMVALTFVLVFLVVIILLKTLVHLNG